MNKNLQKELENLGASTLIRAKHAGNAYRVPNGYFERKQVKLSQIASRRKNYQVPDDYFKQLNQKVMANIDAIEEPTISETKPVTTKRRSLFRLLMGVAAALALLLSFMFVFKATKTNTPQVATTETTLIEETFLDDELAFLGEEEMATYILDGLYEDFDVSSNTSEDILLDTMFEEETSVEDLFTI